jgi:hypothetical protein
VIVLVGAGGLYASASASTSFNNVQVFIHTSQNLPYSYALAAYNTSGIQVASYQSNFAAAALELPDGIYLFTVQASYSPPNNYPCIGCGSGPMVPANSTGMTNSTTMTVMPPVLLPFDQFGPRIPANSTEATNSTSGMNSTVVTVLPIFRLEPSSSEYGYAIEQVTGPSSITIDTYNASTLPTDQVTVHVDYANGTAAQGAWVYASVVDDYYSYGPNVTSGVQTGADGNAVLTMPKAPLLVTSYLSVPVTLPQPQSNITVTIGGQKVNVTLSWEPSSVSLVGQTLILPPQTSGSITLQYQPQQYYYPLPVGLSTPSGVAATTGKTAMASTETTGLGATQGRIPPFSPVNVQSADPIKSVTVNGLGGESLALVGGTVALGVALVALILVQATVRGKRRPSVVSA